MATEVQFHFDANGLQEAIQQAAESAIEEGVKYAFVNIAKRIPANRKKTRRFLRSQIEGLMGTVGIQFPSGSRYESSGTETEQILIDAWRQIEPAARKVVEQTFTQSLEEYVR